MHRGVQNTHFHILDDIRTILLTRAAAAPSPTQIASPIFRGRTSDARPSCEANFSAQVTSPNFRDSED
jgi:hypothetical protein